MKQKVVYGIIITIPALIFIFIFIILPYVIWDVNNLEKGRNYFTSINAYTTFLIGILGLFYYFDKKAKDNYEKIRDLRRQKIQILLAEIKQYDKLVEKILCREIQDQKELEFTRKKLQRSFEEIEMIIQHSKDILKFEMGELIEIVKINSFVEKNEYIMRKSFAALKKSDIAMVRDMYIELIKNAKAICHQKAI